MGRGVAEALRLWVSAALTLKVCDALSNTEDPPNRVDLVGSFALQKDGLLVLAEASDELDVFGMVGMSPNPKDAGAGEDLGAPNEKGLLLTLVDGVLLESRLSILVNREDGERD